MADMSRATVVNSTGQSELLFHRHRDDQIPLWRDHKYRTLAFGKDLVEKGAVDRLTLEPKGK